MAAIMRYRKPDADALHRSSTLPAWTSAECGVLLLLILFAVLLILAVALWGLSRFAHSALYTEVPASLLWRAPVAATAIFVLTLVVPLVIRGAGVKWPMTFNQFLLYSSEKEPVIFKEFHAEDRGRKTVYTRRKAASGILEYVSDDGKPLPRNTEAMIGIPEKGGEPHQFRASKEGIYLKKDRQGNVSYVDQHGNVMTSDSIGKLTLPSSGSFFASFFVALLNIGVWFAALWLLLLFQWPHALGFSIPAFVAWSLCVTVI